MLPFAEDHGVKVLDWLRSENSFCNIRPKVLRLELQHVNRKPHKGTSLRKVCINKA